MLAATVTQSGMVTLNLTNLHGDEVATAADSVDDTGITDGSYSESTEYGAPRVASAASAGYGWLGGKQRSADNLGGLVQMGVRLYDPASGRFLSPDPVYAGDDNSYVYPPDPIDGLDLTGKSRWRRAAHGIVRGARFLTNNRWANAALTACGFIPGAVGMACGGVQAAAYAIQRKYRQAAISAAGMALGGAAAGGLRIAARAIVRAGVRQSFARGGAIVSRRVIRRTYASAEWARTLLEVWSVRLYPMGCDTADADE